MAFCPHVPVAATPGEVPRELKKLRKKGPQSLRRRWSLRAGPIARTSSGARPGCENLERYSDFENRSAARPNLRPQRFGRRFADRARSSPGDGEWDRNSTLLGDRYRTPFQRRAWGSDLQGPFWLRLPRWWNCQGEDFKKRDGAVKPRGGWDSFRAPVKLRMRWPCALDWADMQSTRRQSSMASARGSTRSRTLCSFALRDVDRLVVDRRLTGRNSSRLGKHCRRRTHRR